MLRSRHSPTMLTTVVSNLAYTVLLAKQLARASLEVKARNMKTQRSMLPGEWITSNTIAVARIRLRRKLKFKKSFSICPKLS